MKKILWCAALLGCVFVGCSKEEQAPLPPLGKVALPETVSGFYAGTLPCSNCKARMVQVTLADDSTATVIQTLVTETTKVDTLQGTFSVAAENVTVVLGEGGEKWNLRRDASGNMALLTGAGTVYEDEDGLKAELIRIHKVIKLKKPEDK